MLNEKTLDDLNRSLRTAAEKIRMLRNERNSLGERMELVYSMLEHGRGPARPPTPPMGYEEDIVPELEKLSEIMKLKREEMERTRPQAKKPEKELHFPGRADGNESPKNADTFMGEVMIQARGIAKAAEQALASDDAEVRKEFLRTFFSRTGALADYLGKVGIGSTNEC